MTSNNNIFTFNIVLWFSVAIALAFAACGKSGALDRTATLGRPFQEWTLQNGTYEGNPFDLVASVKFVNPDNGEERVTEMFYAGDDNWKFRFTATSLGNWQFTTFSDDPELDGRGGEVLVIPDSSPGVGGFLTHRGNKFALQRGNSEKPQGYLFNVYMGRANFDSYLESFGTDSAEIADKTVDYLAEANKNGFEIIFLHINNNWFEHGARAHDSHNSVNPDILSFRVLERVITTAHARGGHVHLWAWGDESRKWTPLGVPGGINGSSDRRLQRYIAARLGPLPGWTMGYGFDLHEWTDGNRLNAWASFLHKRFGWQHLLCARGFILNGNSNINSYDGFGRNVPLHTTRGGPQNFHEVLEDIASDTTLPHLYEERHTYNRPEFKLDMDGTRRLLWWQAMAGGMGGFYGFYPSGSSAFGGYPYPAPEQLRTFKAFWHVRQRFILDMSTSISQGNELLMLKDQKAGRCILYQENAEIIECNLEALRGPQKVVAVDTRKEYAEIDLGTVGPQKQKLELPYHSDWAISLGNFPGD
ncbi:MAG: DUF5060 domain-containing protein [Gemmatimonadota bacterium]|nr:DUF5060 domain-containing protein [Gemmatimonadota bacterium]